MPTVLIRVDEAGEEPVIVHDGEELLSDPGVRWRLVAECDDLGQARALVELLHRRRDETRGRGSGRPEMAAHQGARSPREA
jgi:hypothetical protein